MNISNRIVNRKIPVQFSVELKQNFGRSGRGLLKLFSQHMLYLVEL